MSKFGILLQGLISEWTKKIIEEYKRNFPDVEILLSTWENENTADLQCKIIKSKSPKFTHPFQLNVNHQKAGILAGLEQMDCEVIMKCRTDQYIHNKEIFQIFEKYCPKNKIMISNYTTLEKVDYFASDMCQIAKKELLEEFWKSIPLYGGSFLVSHPEIYLTASYILQGKKDFSPWI